MYGARERNDGSYRIHKLSARIEVGSNERVGLVEAIVGIGSLSPKAAF